MLRCEINAAGSGELYLAALNRCFPGWGDARQFEWAFRRTAGGPPADLLVLSEGDTTLAGSAVTYRTLELARGARILVGIMTGSWTLPEARGRGCFTRIIDESVARTRGHGGAVLLAFVTEDNASYRRLRDAGAGLFPSAYLFSPEEGFARPEGAPPLAAVDATDALVADVAARRERGWRGAGHVAYAGREWREQFLERAHPTELCALGDRGFAVVERAGAFLRLLGTCVEGAPHGDIVRAALARAAEEKRRLFLFSMETALTAAATDAGLRAAPGNLTALAADAEALRAAVGVAEPWPGGDSRALADPSSRWYLGPIRFESGDRM